MNSFGDVEWLPESGTTPDKLAYPFDRLQELFELKIAGSTKKEIDLCVKFAYEKLAEASEMIKNNNTSAAALALKDYDTYKGRAGALVEELPAENHSGDRTRYVTFLLEHVYIMSVEYLDMPLGVRTILSPLFSNAMTDYERHSAKLPKSEKDVLFFKEEEVYWSLEMLSRADDQRITN